MMSRLDSITVAIVVVCLAALGFLVYKTVNLMNGNSDSDTQTEAVTPYVDPYPIDTTLKDSTDFKDPAFSSTDEDLDDAQVSSYSEEDDIAKGKSTSGKTTSKGAVEPALKTTTEPKSTATKPAATTEKKAATTTKPKATTPSAASTKPKAATVESYSVQAGAFKSKSNAEVLVKELKRLGYPNAEVVSTAALASAVVDRFSTYEEAAAMVKALKTKHNIDALVKHKK